MEYSKQTILNKAEKHHLHLDEDTIEFMNIGLDFQVAFGTDGTGKQWVLRLPRREDALLKTKREKQILDLLNISEIPFAVPKWEIYSEELIAYPLLEGVPAVTTNAETQETSWEFDQENVPGEYTESLGQALASLHAIPIEKMNEVGLGLDSHNLREDMKQRMDTVKNAYTIDSKLWDRWQNWLAADALWPKKAGFIHGDLYPGHTMIDNHYSVTGIIDWTEAKMADVSNDFVSHYMLFGENELEKLIQAYGEAGGYKWPKMTEHIIELNAAQAITIAEFAISSSLDEYDQMARKMLMTGN